MHQVVIIGGGFAGLNAAKVLRRTAVAVTVLDRRNFHLFQPLLYQVATGGLSPGDITAPIRHVLNGSPNTRVLLSEARGIDLAGRRVLTDHGDLGFDMLIVATGVRHHYFAHPAWENFAPGLKTIEDAIEIRRQILEVFEQAEHAGDPFLSFVIVGAGPTGVELAGALAELSRDTLRSDFRQVDPTKARILLVEGSGRVLPGYPPDLSKKALRSLNRLGVEVRLETMVSAIDAEGVTLTRNQQPERIASRCVLWSAGVRASSLGSDIANQSSAVTDRMGRLKVLPDLSVPGYPNVFVTGDLAHVQDAAGSPLPGVAPVAIQQGRYVGNLIKRRLAGKPVSEFRYVDKGSLATIGRRAAVADFGRLRFAGAPAWMLWLGIHLFFLVGFENRVLVFFKWAVNYFSRNRGARLIVGAKTSPGPPEPDTT